MNQIVIQVQDVTKRYKRYKKGEGLKGSIRSLFSREYDEKTAVSHMNLTIKAGEFVGLIGENGAGKTTLIKMLTGIIAPTEGELNVLGYYPNDLKTEFKKQYAVVMGQKSQLFYELTVNDTLRLFKEIYEISEEDFQETKEYFVHLFGVQDLMDVQVRTLSLGERMKMELMVALLHNPKILLLDEPTIGLDAVASKQIRKFLKEINEQRGTTILLTSHYMEDIRALCKRCIVVNGGCKVYDGDTEELFHKFQQKRRITVSFDHPIEGLKVGVESARLVDDTMYKKIYEVDREDSNILLAELMSFGPIDMSVEEEEIGNVVERIYGKGSGQYA